MTQVEQACAAFRTLLTEQMARAEAMEHAAPAKDFTKLEKVSIGVIGGDGIGPIIVDQAERVLGKLLADEIAAGRIVLKNIPGLTIENRLEKVKLSLLTCWPRSRPVTFS